MVICLSDLPELGRIDTLVLFGLAPWRLAVSFLSSLFHCQNITAFPVVEVHYLFGVSSFLCRSSNQTLTYWNTRNRTETVTLSELRATITTILQGLDRIRTRIHLLRRERHFHYVTSPFVDHSQQGKSIRDSNSCLWVQNPSCLTSTLIDYAK